MVISSHVMLNFLAKNNKASPFNFHYSEENESSYLSKIIYWNLILLTFLLNKLDRVSMFRVVLIVFLLVLFIETQYAICISKAPYLGCLETEREALIDFKTGLYDPQNLLSS